MVIPKLHLIDYDLQKSTLVEDYSKTIEMFRLNQKPEKSDANSLFITLQVLFRR